MATSAPHAGSVRTSHSHQPQRPHARTVRGTTEVGLKLQVGSTVFPNSARCQHFDRVRKCRFGNPSQLVELFSVRCDTELGVKYVLFVFNYADLAYLHLIVFFCICI